MYRSLSSEYMALASGYRTLLSDTGLIRALLTGYVALLSICSMSQCVESRAL